MEEKYFIARRDALMEYGSADGLTREEAEEIIQDDLLSEDLIVLKGKRVPLKLGD